MTRSPKGAFVAGMGIPGSGKSSVFGALADLLIRDGVKTTLYREPEETEWPAAVRQRDTYGRFTALTWFRSQRVPYLFQAAADRADGAVALVDSYYDKLIHLYFDDPALEWLMTKQDSYRTAYKDVIGLDHKSLPDADCVVTLTVEADRWRELVQSRGRQLDREANILTTYETQESFRSSAERYCKEKGIPHIVVENNQSTAAATAAVLREELVKVGIIQ